MPAVSFTHGQGKTNRQSKVKRYNKTAQQTEQDNTVRTTDRTRQHKEIEQDNATARQHNNTNTTVKRYTTPTQQQ